MNNCCILIFKGLNEQRLYKSFGVKVLNTLLKPVQFTAGAAHIPDIKSSFRYRLFFHSRVLQLRATLCVANDEMRVLTQVVLTSYTYAKCRNADDSQK
jgi:hypothetical protein